MLLMPYLLYSNSEFKIISLLQLFFACFPPLSDDVQATVVLTIGASILLAPYEINGSSEFQRLLSYGVLKFQLEQVGCSMV